MIKKGFVNILVDGQWGSTGKGKLAGWLLSHYSEIDTVVSDFMPNAGHTFIADTTERFMFKMLPMGSLFPNVKRVLVGPHAVISKPILFKELEIAGRVRQQKVPLYIHPFASVLSYKDKEAESLNLRHVASTMQGCAEAQIRKMRRNPDNCILAYSDGDLSHFVADTHQLLTKTECTTLIETSQGFDLSLNAGHSWPFVTSRDCLLGRFLDNAGAHPRMLGSIIGSIRCHPIRVGNIEGGTSGPCYTDQREMVWEEISQMCGKDVREYTSVTKRVRRVFSFSMKQLYRFLRYCQPDYMFMNFVNYLPDGKDSNWLKFIGKTMMEYSGCQLKLLGTGAKNSEMELLT